MNPHRVEVAQPFHASALFGFLARHAVKGVEVYSVAADPDEFSYARTVRLPAGPALIRLVWSRRELTADLALTSAADADAAVRLIRRMCDLDVDPLAVDGHLGRDPHLGPLVAVAPGLRVPGTVDPTELLFRTMIGQQISLAAAARCAAELVERFGEPYPSRVLPGPGINPASVMPGQSGLTRLFPTAAALAAADPGSLPMPRARGRALVAMASALADGSMDLSGDADSAETRARLLACAGVGPWTADYLLMRGYRARDVLLASDLVIRRELTRRRIDDTTGWAPWRSYATMHLWHAWLAGSGRESPRRERGEP